MRKYIYSTIILLGALVVTVYAQSRGTPSTLRVLVDANGALVTAATAQVAPITSVTFSNARLAIDANGNLLTVISGGSGVGTVTNIATTSPITGGPITTTGTIACATCAVLDSPVFTTKITAPVVVGGTGTTSTLTLKPTSGSGTTGSDIILQVGNNGAVEAARFYSTGLSTYGTACAATGCDAVPTTGFLFTGGNIILDRFNAAAGGALILGRHARGTITSPGQTLSGDNLVNIVGRGWQSTGPAWTTASNGVINIVAADNFTSTTQGTNITMAITPVGSITGQTILTISAAGLISSGQALAVANVGANSCGTTTATVAGNATAGEVTVGATAGTQCRVTIPQATTTRLNGSCNNQTTANLCRFIAVDTTHFDLIGTFVAGDVIAFISLGR